MKTSLLLSSILLCALPLGAQGGANGPANHLAQANARSAARRVSAVCQLTTANIVPSSRTVAPPAREFVMQVTNNSDRAIKLPKQPEFGWRVEILEKRGWKLRAEGGPVHLLKAEDQHIVSTAAEDAGQLMEIAPSHGELFYFVLPDAKKALAPYRPFSRVRLNIYWSPSANVVEKEPDVLPCALAVAWVVDVQKAPAEE